MVARSRIRETTGERLFSLTNVVVMVVLVIVTLYPLLYIGFASLSDPALLAQHRGLLFGPLDVTFEAYRRVFQNPMILTGYRNTLFYVVAGTALNVVMTSLGAYALSRRNLLFKNPIMFLIVFTMFFSGGLIPTYLLVQSLGLTDSYLALILPSAISVFNILVLRGFFMGISQELIDSARIDGAGDFRILWQIVMPLSRAVLAVITLFYAVGYWSAWFNASLYLNDQDMMPLQNVMIQLVQKQQAPVGLGQAIRTGQLFV